MELWDRGVGMKERRGKDTGRGKREGRKGGIRCEEREWRGSYTPIEVFKSRSL